MLTQPVSVMKGGGKVDVGGGRVFVGVRAKGRGGRRREGREKIHNVLF